MNQIRVLIADDHVVLRRGLTMLLNAEPDIEVIGEVGDGREAIAKTVEVAPDVILLDITMPHLGGIDAIHLIKEKRPEVAILILTMHDNEAYLRQALKAGALGYITKKAAESELISAIRAVHRGEIFIYSSLTRALVQEVIYSDSSGQQSEADGKEKLSRRELEVLRLVAQGYTNKQVADKFCLSLKTVESYKARVMDKLNLCSRVELVRYAFQHGLLDSDLE